MKFPARSLFLVSALGSVLFIACGDSDTYFVDYGEDADEDGWPDAFDCDDEDDSIFPAADEIPGDGIDQDCSGSDQEEWMSFGGAANCRGEECAPTGMAGSGQTGGAGTGGISSGAGGREPTVGDLDGDGFSPPEDCDDTRFEVNPDAREVVLNHIDENCDGSDLIGNDDIVSVFPKDAVLAQAARIAPGRKDGSDVVLAVWADSRTAPAQDLYGQMYDAEGRPLADPLEIETTDNAAKYGVRVASKGNSYLVTWTTAEGVWGQRLDESGENVGAALLIGGEGTSEPRPAYRDGYWAVAFRDIVATTGFIRAMTQGGARGDIIELGNGEITALELGPTTEGFVALWEGPWQDGRALVAQPTTRTGVSSGEAFVVTPGPVASPGVGFDGSDALVAFHTPGSFGYSNVILLEGGTRLSENAEPQRISTESRWQSDFFLGAADSGFFVAWSDQRHAGGQPPAQSIYANHWSSEGVASSTSLPILAGEKVDLGGIVVLENRALISVLTEQVAGLVELDF